jgi:hypothetical protein
MPPPPQSVWFLDINLYKFSNAKWQLPDRALNTGKNIYSCFAKYFLNLKYIYIGGEKEDTAILIKKSIMNFNKM